MALLVVVFFFTWISPKLVFRWPSEMSRVVVLF